MTKATPRQFDRVLLKISGEALMGPLQFGIDMPTLNEIAVQIGEARRSGVQLAVVVGGGNIFRGMKASAAGMDRATADYMGMLATIMNGMAIQDALEKKGVDTRLMDAIGMQSVAEPYIRRRAVRHIEKGRVVIFTAGTGNPFMTTDTAAALRAAEIQAKVVMKGTKVDGVYDKDPVAHADARRYDVLTYDEVINAKLRVMDTTAVSLCQENALPIVVFDMTDPTNIVRAVRGDDIGTLVS